MVEALPSLYVCGPMSGLPAFNYPAFDAAAAKLRGAGFVVHNPAENSAPEGAEWADYMRLAVAQLVTADAVALLPESGRSRGARLELHLASSLGMPVRSVPGWLTLSGQRSFMARLLAGKTTNEGA